MYNRYIGNTGRRYRVEDAPRPKPASHPAPDSAQRQPKGQQRMAENVRRPAGGTHRPAENAGERKKPPSGPACGSGGIFGLGGLFGGAGGLTSSLRAMIPSLPFGLDMGDLLLLLTLFLLYTESGDEDFLIMLVVVGFSFFREQ